MRRGVGNVSKMFIKVNFQEVHTIDALERTSYKMLAGSRGDGCLQVSYSAQVTAQVSFYVYFFYCFYSLNQRTFLYLFRFQKEEDKHAVPQGS